MEGSDDTCAIVCTLGSGEFRRPLAVHAGAEISLTSGLEIRRVSSARYFGGERPIHKTLSLLVY